jgi:hypothetical protein
MGITGYETAKVEHRGLHHEPVPCSLVPDRWSLHTGRYGEWLQVPHRWRYRTSR